MGNVADGRINAFDGESGHFAGTLTLTSGQPFAVVGLWGLMLGSGSPNNGATNQLFFTAGPPAPGHPIFSNGLFGVIMSATDKK